MLTTPLNYTPALWFHGYTCNYPWTFHTGFVLASSLVHAHVHSLSHTHTHTHRQARWNTGSLLTTSLDTHGPTATVEKLDVFCERQLTNRILLFCCRRRLPVTQKGAWNWFFARCVLAVPVPDDPCLYLIMSRLVLILLSISSVSYVIFMH